MALVNTRFGALVLPLKIPVQINCSWTSPDCTAIAKTVTVMVSLGPRLNRSGCTAKTGCNSTGTLVISNFLPDPRFSLPNAWRNSSTLELAHVKTTLFRPILNTFTTLLTVLPTNWWPKSSNGDSSSSHTMVLPMPKAVNGMVMSPPSLTSTCKVSENSNKSSILRETTASISAPGSKWPTLGLTTKTLSRPSMKSLKSAAMGLSLKIWRG
mmetsp:Transcript_28606/g.52602  ORF Transcript_28606/g.52602 Transcript_28606/m.52602 type:complete len:211 (-) Transcript_28606:624-1256(-)